MVKYDFKCNNCDHIFEIESSYGKEVKPKCPECRSSKVRKVILATSVHYKGDGFTLSKSEE